MSARIEYLRTTQEVAKIFDVSVQTVRLWIEEGKLKGYRVPLNDGKNIPAEDRRGTLWITTECLTEWAQKYWEAKR